MNTSQPFAPPHFGTLPYHTGPTITVGKLPEVEALRGEVEELRKLIIKLLGKTL